MGEGGGRHLRTGSFFSVCLARGGAAAVAFDGPATPGKADEGIDVTAGGVP